jgi:hypothetical protein
MSVGKQPEERHELRAAWLAWWRANASSLPAVYEPEVLERILGADPVWRTAGSAGD